MSRMESGRQIADVVATLGAEIFRSQNMQVEKAYLQHGNVSSYDHSVSVAYISVWMARRLHIDVDMRSLVRGALLHDYFLYDWHAPDPEHKWHGFIHARKALENAARDFDLNAIEGDVIEKHMFPLTLGPPRYKESAIVCCADKICAIRELLRFNSMPSASGIVGEEVSPWQQ